MNILLKLKRRTKENNNHNKKMKYKKCGIEIEMIQQQHTFIRKTRQRKTPFIINQLNVFLFLEIKVI